MKQRTVIRMGAGFGKKSSTDSSIVNTMHICFKSDKRRIGNSERSIMNSAEKYFEKQPPKEAA